MIAMEQDLIDGLRSAIVPLLTIVFVIGLVYLVARKSRSIERALVSFTDLFIPYSRPTHAKVEEKVDDLIGECARLRKENEDLKKRIEWLIASGEADQKKIRAHFRKPERELDTDDDG